MINNQNNRRVASVTRLRMVTESDSFINKNTEEFQNENSIFETD